MAQISFVQKFWSSLSISLLLGLGILAPVYSQPKSDISVNLRTNSSLIISQLGGNLKSQSLSREGRFQVAYVTIQNSKYQDLEQALIDSKLFDMIAEGLNEIIILPSNITIILQECGTINAFYSPQDQAIIMCYELIEDFANFSSQYAATEEELLQATLGGTMYVFAHELGHALIHVLDLPAVGREEDAADQLAIIIATELGKIEGQLGEFGKQMVIIPAMQYRMRSGQSNVAYWDEHPLDLQRYYNIICLFYGSNPSEYKTIATMAELPGDRAQKCPAEYEKIYSSWFRLLQPHINPEYLSNQ